MSLSENLTNAIRDGIRDTPLTDQPNWVVLTEEQYEAIRQDAYRRDIVRTPPPWGRSSTLTPSTLGVPVLVRAIGADISDLTGTVLDVREVS